MIKVSDNAASSSKNSDKNPPQLNFNLPSVRDIQKTTKEPKDAHLPVDILLLTVKDCEFLACYNELKDPYRCWFDGLGYVYFEDMDESDGKKVTVALLRCNKNGIGSGGSLTSVKTAATKLRPKAVISVGTCGGLNPEKTKLGDVVVSEKLTTYATGMRSCVSRRFLDVIKHSADGWNAPLKNPKSREVEVHREGEFLSGPEQVSAEWRREQLADLHPQASAIEMDGEGIFTAAFDSQIEWLIVKGVANYADGSQLTAESWYPFASVMAASLVTHILSDPGVFHSWPHYQDLSECDTASKPKKARLSAEDSAAAFLEWSQNQLCSFYNSTMSQVMITPWDPDNTMDLDEVYVQLSLQRDDRKLDGTTKEKLKDYGEIFVGYGRHLTPKRILVYGKPGIGKSTFSKKLAVDWARGEKEDLKKFTVLLLVRLRDVCNTQNLRTMLERSELLSADDPVVFNQLYDYILKNQEKVLFVLDGYDEYSAEKPSPVYQIWRGSQLRDCTILVTTRPSKDDELRISSHVQFKINGFDYKQVEQFVRKFLSDQIDTIRAFTGFLTERDLWDMAKIPLLLLMLCLTWKEKDRRGLPKSRAVLYESFFQTLWDHLAAKESESFTSIDKYKDDLSKLGRLAFDALLIDCLYFELSKVPEDIRLLIKKFLAVGFFQLSKLSSSPRPEEIVHFLHKTVQEFLSACFIVQQLTNAKKGHVTCLSKVDSFKKIKEMYEVLKFVCELSSEAASAVLDHLRMIGEKEGLTKYCFTDNPSVKNDLSEDQAMFHFISLDFFLSRPASDRQAIYPFFLQCVNSVVVIIDSGQLSIVAKEHVLRLCTSLKPNYLFVDKSDFYIYSGKFQNDFFSIMCDLETVVVTCYGDTKPVNKYMNLGRHFFVKKEGGQMIFCITDICKPYGAQLSLELSELSELVSAPQSDSLSSQQPVDQILQNQDASKSLCLTEETSSSDQNQKHSLSFVRAIEIDNPTSEELTVVNKVLTFVNRLQVMKIELSPSLFPKELFNVQLLAKLESLVSRICPTYFTDSLLTLSFEGFHMTEMSVVRFGRSLHQVPNLKKLNLSRICLSNAGFKTLTGNLHHVKHLTKLELSGVEIGHLECQLLATALKHVGNLNVLDLSFNPLAHGITELSKHLNSVPHLTVLKLCHTNMGEEEVTAVACALKYVQELKDLDLSYNPLAHGITELSKHLNSVPHLTKLKLCKTDMGEEEVTAVACALKYAPEQEVLDLSSNPMGRGVSELTKHLSSVPHLRYLSLSFVKMTRKEARELCTAALPTKMFLETDYHVRTDSYSKRLCTEAELKENGVTFDDEE